MILYREGNHVAFERKSGLLAYLNVDDINIQQVEGGRMAVTMKPNTKLEETRVVHPTDIENHLGDTPYATIDDVVHFIFKGDDINITDQTTPAILAPMNKIVTNTAMTNAVAAGTYQVTLDSVANLDTTVNNFLIFFDIISNRFMFSYATAINGNIVTLDRLVDYPFPAGTFVDICRVNMGGEVGSLASPVTYGMRGPGGELPGVEITFDITRLMFACRTSTAVDLQKFADLPKLTNGLQFRQRDGTYRNLFEIKNNGGLAALCYDWTPYSATNPQQGQNGFVARMTFAGQNKIGVALRVPLGEDIETIILDSLVGITEYVVVCEGHLTTVQ